MTQYSGEGTLFIESKGETYPLEVYFSCSQKSDGKVYGWVNLRSNDTFNYIKILNERGNSNRIDGITEEGYKINIEKINLFRVQYSASNSQNDRVKTSERKDMEFAAIVMEVYGNLVKFDKIEFGIINFDLFRKIQTQISNGIINFKVKKDIKELIELIRMEKQPQLTVIAEYTPNKETQYDSSLLDELEHELNKLLELTSFAQGITQGSCYAELFHKGELIYGRYRWIKTRKHSFYPIIWSPNISKFITKCYPRYSDSFREKNGLSLFIEFYLEALSSITAEAKIILSFTALEHILYRYKTLKDKNQIIELDHFNKIRKEIERAISSILKKHSIEAGRRKYIYDKIPELNRYSFNAILEEYLDNLNIGHEDIFLKFNEIKDIRDQIIHRGKAECDSKTLYDTQMKIEALLHRIFLSLFEYDGEDWINCYKDYSYDKFNREGTE